MHNRNRYRQPHDFAALARLVAPLSDHFVTTVDGRNSLNFAQPEAVRLLNKALLLRDYDLRHWDIPPGNLCPGVPGRLDYIHVVADLLEQKGAGTRVRGKGRKKRGRVGLDVGTGASLIYPILGVKEYGWRFVGTDIDVNSLRVAGAIVEFNPSLTGSVRLRHQPDPKAVFSGVVRSTDYFDFTLCNPPFFDSPDEAAGAARRKWAKLGRPDASADHFPTLNFGGRPNELWTPGGEAGFLRRMIRESVHFRERVGWFTTLVSKKGYLRIAEIEFAKRGIRDFEVINIGQGGKKRRVLAWRG